MTLSHFWDSFPSLKTRLARVANEIEQVWSDSPSPVREDLEPLLLTPGKMLRPAFFLMAASASEEDRPEIYRTAASVELLHTASLIHDDILDNAATRRGIPTLNSRFGIRKAVLEGDYLLSRALQLASGSHDSYLMSAVNRSMEGLCLSEIDQDFSQGSLAIGKERYLNRIKGKTAELFGLSLQAGAHLGGMGEEDSRMAYDAGIAFGISFQIEDDILDYRGSATKLGKPTGKDLREGIPTLPLILALEGGDRVSRFLSRPPWRSLFAPGICRRIDRLGFLEKAEEESRSWLDRSLERAERLDFPDKPLFREVVGKLLRREF